MPNEIAHSHSSTPKLIAGFSVAAVVLVLGIVWLLCSALIESHTSEVRHLHIQQLCGTIIHLDEVLTMSAKMCAATGNMDWQERYDRYELKLDKAIQEAEALVPLGGPEPSEDISVVNARLVEMEQEAFRLTAQGMRPEAMALLESDQYKLDKQKYSEATQDRVHAMLKDVGSSLGTQRWESLTTTAGAIVVMCLILGTAFISLKAMRRHLAQLGRTEESLREAHETLEHKVEERTAELVISSEELQAIYDGMVDGLLIADIETKKFVRANHAICKMLGHSEEEMLSLSVMEIHPPNDLAGVLEKFEAQAEGRLAVAENLPVLRKDGSVFHADITANHLVYRGRSCSIGFFRDITDRKKAEEELRKSEETARALINASTESEFLVEPDGTIVTLNETAAIRIGKTVEELVGECGYDYMPADLARSRREHGEEVIRTGELVRFEDQRDGRVFDICFYPVFDASGRVARVAVYAQDVTERKAAEEAVQEEQRHLRNSLEASDRERQTISDAIHDGITQHLTAAIMQFQAVATLQSRNPEKASKTLDAGLETLGRALFEARRLIGGVRPPILDDMGIVAAVEHLVSDIKSKGGPEIVFEADVEFRRLAPSTENSFFRIIQESLTNACIHSDSDKVRIAIQQQGETLQIEVQDWGVGFDKDNIEEGSFGIEGFRERARLLGGNVIIDSKPGKGTRVVVRLPLPEEA
jgi:PAS domain S-box-containing protein